MYYDVVIIGGGPGGMSAAHNLINNNISCCVIDKQIFPRNKLCAGGITKKTMELLNELNLGHEFKGDNTLISKNASLHLGYNHIVDVVCEGDTYLVDRYEFDEYLVRSYENKGGKLIEGTRVEAINTKENSLLLSDNITINYKYIIGADGAVGISRREVDKEFAANGFCLQAEIPREEFKYEHNNMNLYYGVLPYGYGWIFPKKDYLTVGFIGDYNKEIDYKSEFGSFLSSLGINTTLNKYKGAFVPFGDYIKYPINSEKNLLLVGDAAGFVDPITGEGIYFAVLSGIKASTVICSSIKNNNKDYIEGYIKEIQPITNSLEQGCRVKKPIYNYKKGVFTLFKNKKIATKLFNKCMYNSNYNLKIYR